MDNKNKILLWVILWLLSIPLQSCENCDTVDPVPTEPARFIIVDLNGKNLVTDHNSRFAADSVKLFAGKENFIISRQMDPQFDGYVFESYPPNDASGKTELALYLNHLDTDTLTTFYEYHKGKCSSYYSYTGFLLNGIEIKKSPAGIISITKPE